MDKERTEWTEIDKLSDLTRWADVPPNFKPEYVMEGTEPLGGEIGRAVFENGKLAYIHSDEVPPEDREEAVAWDAGRFENLFIPFPHPFEKGDIVCHMTSTIYGWGVVATSHKKSMAQMKVAADKPDAGFRDGCLRVYFPQEGKLMFDDVSPIFLDKVENLREDDKNDALLLSLSKMLKGKRTLDQFLNDYDMKAALYWAKTRGDFY